MTKSRETKSKNEMVCDLCVKYEDAGDYEDPQFSCGTCYSDCCEKHFGKNACTDCGEE